jgi:hypothetical protein
MVSKPQAVKLPAGVTPITSRSVAEVLQCSMGHVRNLALKSRLKSWKLGSRSIVFDLKEVQEYKKTMERWRKEGHRGASPGGFRPDKSSGE